MIAAATLAAAIIAAITSFAVGLTRFHLQVPWLHTLRIAFAAAAMAAALLLLPEARNIPLLIGSVSLGAAAYALVLALVSLPWLMRLRTQRAKLTAAE